jgi:hypothetical protein
MEDLEKRISLIEVSENANLMIDGLEIQSSFPQQTLITYKKGSGKIS